MCLSRAFHSFPQIFFFSLYKSGVACRKRQTAPRNFIFLRNPNFYPAILFIRFHEAFSFKKFHEICPFLRGSKARHRQNICHVTAHINIHCLIAINTDSFDCRIFLLRPALRSCFRKAFIGKFKRIRGRISQGSRLLHPLYRILYA